MTDKTEELPFNAHTDIQPVSTSVKPMPKTLNEIRYGQKTEGMKAKVTQLEGALLTIEAFSLFESEFAPGACVQCSQGEKKVWFVTHSEYMIETLALMKGNEPYVATPTCNRSASDRTYYTLE